MDAVARSTDNNNNNDDCDFYVAPISLKPTAQRRPREARSEGTMRQRTEVAVKKPKREDSARESLADNTARMESETRVKKVHGTPPTTGKNDAQRAKGDAFRSTLKIDAAPDKVVATSSSVCRDSKNRNHEKATVVSVKNEADAETVPENSNPCDDACSSSSSVVGSSLDDLEEWDEATIASLDMALEAFGGGGSARDAMSSSSSSRTGAGKAGSKDRKYGGMVPNREQRYILEKARQGYSMYVGGGPGSGKTALMNMITAIFDEEGLICGHAAPTWLAADHIGGVSIYNMFGFQPNDTPELFTELFEKSRRKGLSNSYRAIIVDEISMVSPKVLEMMDHVARISRKRMDLPFGGLQVIFVGDFYQLPPVDRTVGKNEEPPMAFESLSWDALFVDEGCKGLMFLLRTNVRQSNDPDFADIVDRMRRGDRLMDLRKKLQDMVQDQGKLQEFYRERGYPALKLFPFVDKSRAANESEFAFVSRGKRVHTYKLEFIVGKPDANAAGGKTERIPEETLTLCEGSRVIVNRNPTLKGGNPDWMKNGMMGTVKGFRRLRKLSESPASLEDEKDLEDYESPLVLFDKFPKQKPTPIRKDVWEIRGISATGKEYVICSKRQLPLSLAWGITIHKSQGMTLDEAEMDLRGCFAEGQAMVAVSRVRSSTGLLLVSAPGRILVSQKVGCFYARTNFAEIPDDYE